MVKIFKSFINQFREWNKIEKYLMVIAIVGSIILTMLWDDTLFGLSVTLTGILCVILVSKKSNWNYLWGTYNVIGYAYLAYTWGLGGDFMLNAFYFLPMQFIGLWMWSKHLEKGSTVKARELTKGGYILLFQLLFIFTLVYSVLLKDVIAPAFASTKFYFATYDTYWLYLADSVSTIFSIAAMYLMVKRYAAQWLLWIIVNIASIVMWSIALALNKDIGGFAASGAPAMILMWTIYLLNAIYGYRVWIISSRK